MHCIYFIYILFFSHVIFAFEDLKFEEKKLCIKMQRDCLPISRFLMVKMIGQIDTFQVGHTLIAMVLIYIPICSLFSYLHS